MKYVLTFLLGLSMALIAMPGLAQDEAPGSMFYVISADIHPGGEAAYTEALASVVEAHKKHDNGNSWATYTNVTGEGTSFVFFVPIQKMGDMDGWAQPQEVLTESLGAAKAAKVGAALAANSASETRVVTECQQWSKPSETPSMAPPAYLYFTGFRPAPDQMETFAKGAGAWVKAARKNDDVDPVLCLQTTIGGQGAEYGFFTGIDSFAAIDDFPGVPAVLAEEYGAAEAARMMDATSAIASRRSIMAFVPELSNIQAP